MKSVYSLPVLILSVAVWGQDASPLMMRSQLPPAIESKLSALQKQTDWKGMDLYIRSLEPPLRLALHEDWLKALRKSGDSEGVLQVCEECLPALERKSGPRLSVARIYRALALGELNRHPQAMQAHLENAKLGYPSGDLNACAEAQKHQDWEALIECGERLAKHDPGHGLSFKGEALSKLKRYQEALPVLESAVQNPSATSMAWADLALCRVEADAYEAAIKAADCALAKEPENVIALYNRARAWMGLKAYEKGRADFAAAQRTGKADEDMRKAIQEMLDVTDRYLNHAKASSDGTTKPKGLKNRSGVKR